MRSIGFRFVALAFAVAVSWPLVAAQQPSAAAKLFQEGLLLEQAGGKTADAIFRYERVIAEFPKDRDVVPKALYHLGVVYEKQQNPRAVLMFSRLADEFPTAAPFAADARTRLASLQQADGGPFKSRTLGFLGISHPFPSPDGRYLVYVKVVKPTGPMPDLGLGADFKAIFDDVMAPTRLVLYEYATGKEQFLVPDTATFGDVQWSPDSQRVAFEVTEQMKSLAEMVEEPKAGKRQVVDVAKLKVQTLQLPGVTELSWSPDSQRIATRDTIKLDITTLTASKPSEVRVTTLSTNQSRSIGSTDGPAEFAWSPDNTRLAFHATDKASKLDEVRILALATGQVTTLAVPPASDGTRSQLGAGFRTKWTTKNELSYRVERPKLGGDIYLISVGGGASRTVCEARGMSGGAGCISMTADGTGILRRDSAAGRLLWLDVATGVNRPVTASSGEETFRSSSPELKLVAFTANRDGRWGLYVAPPGVGTVQNPVRIAPLDGPPTNVFAQGWSTTGRLVLGFSFTHSDVYRIDMDRQTGHAKGQPERLTQDSIDNDSAAMSPDGLHIAYWYRAGSKQGIAVMDTSGANERPLLDHAFGADNSPLVWLSADEVGFFENSPKDGPRTGLVAVNIKNGATRPLPHGEMKDTYWAYLPSRNELLYVDTEARDGFMLPLKARSLIDGTERVLSKDGTVIASFVVSRDGQRLAYATLAASAIRVLEDIEKAMPQSGATPEGVKTAAALLAAKHPFELHVAGLDGTSDRIVARASLNIMAIEMGGGLQPFSFSPDGQFLLYDATDSNTIRIVSVNGGESWPLLDKNVATPGVTWSGANWGSDGSVLLKGALSRKEFKAWDGVTYAAVVKLLGAARRP